ncbi:unnamed protein product, partial [Rotaria magnacalcarata]
HVNSNCYLFDLFDVQGFAFEIKHVDEFDKIAQCINTVTNYLVSSDIAHNMAIMKGDSFSSSQLALRVFVWLRQSNIGAKTFHQWNIGCLELSGYTFLQYEEIFKDANEGKFREYINGIALSSEVQQKIRDDVKNLLEQ